MDVARAALIIASHEYQDPGLRRLRAPARDAEALARVLGDPEVGDFDVRTLLNEPEYIIREVVAEFFADRRPDDLLLLHFSCHGVKDEGGELYFATTNTKVRLLGATAVAAEFVNRCMNRSRSRRVVLLLDCCYAGAFERGMAVRAERGVGIEERFGGRGRAVITASSAMEYAFEGNELVDSRDPTPSVFTSALVEGLETGEADRDQDGQVGLDELYDYVYDRVRESTPNQTPGKWMFGVQGELYIARRSQPVTKPAALPPELQDAIDNPLSGVRAVAVRELGRLLRSRHAGLALAAKQALESLTEDDSRTVSDAARAVLDADQEPAAQSERVPPRLEELVDDDSRAVSAAAAAALRGDVPPTASEATVPRDPVPPPVPQPGPAPSADVDRAPAVRAASARPEEAALPRAPASSTLAAPPRGETPARPVGAGADSRSRRAPDKWRVLAAGGLALVTAGLLVMSTLPSYYAGRFRVVDDLASLMVVVIVAALVAGAGTLILVPATGPLIGPGILLGTAVYMTLYLQGPLRHYGHHDIGPGLVLRLVAYAILTLGTVLAMLGPVRSKDVRVARWPPVGRLPWLVALIGGAGALYSFVFFVGLPWGDIDGYGKIGGVWAGAMALLMPLAAAGAAPRRFGAALLGGWAGAGVAGILDGVLHDPLSALSDPEWWLGTVIGVALLIMVVPLARSARDEAAV